MLCEVALMSVYLSSPFLFLCMFFGYFTNLLHDKMAVIAPQIVEDDWYLDFINL